MIVRIRFGLGPLVTRRKGQKSRLVRLLASSLTLLAVSCGILGFWRVAQDLDWVGNFPFAEGIRSHSQFWLAAMVGAQYGAWKLKAYARALRRSIEVAQSDNLESSEPRTTASA